MGPAEADVHCHTQGPLELRYLCGVSVRGNGIGVRWAGPSAERVGYGEVRKTPVFDEVFRFAVFFF